MSHHWDLWSWKFVVKLEKRLVIENRNDQSSSRHGIEGVDLENQIYLVYVQFIKTIKNTFLTACMRHAAVLQITFILGISLTCY